MLNPSDWYSRFTGYKGLNPDDRLDLMSLFLCFWRIHGGVVEDLLGGEATFTIVPSTRKPFDAQPLKATMELNSSIRARFTQALEHVAGAVVPRSRYLPSAFAALPHVAGGRFVLVEDYWVTGSKAVSAAGALIEAGARDVAIIPIGRQYKKDMWTPLEYLPLAAQPHDVAQWPLG